MRPLIYSLLFVATTLPLRADDFPALYNTEKEDSKPMTPEEAVKTAELPPGFHLEVFAS